MEEKEIIEVLENLIKVSEKFETTFRETLAKLSTTDKLKFLEIAKTPKVKELLEKFEGIYKLIQREI